MATSRQNAELAPHSAIPEAVARGVIKAGFRLMPGQGYWVTDSLNGIKVQQFLILEMNVRRVRGEVSICLPEYQN